jgi:hypothetical protein
MDTKKNNKAKELARQVAAETGKGLRSAPDLAETLMEIGRRCSSLPDLDTRSAEEILGYDAKEPVPSRGWEG